MAAELIDGHRTALGVPCVTSDPTICPQALTAYAVLVLMEVGPKILRLVPVPPDQTLATEVEPRKLSLPEITPPLLIPKASAPQPMCARTE
jgi:hypothetical protein